MPRPIYEITTPAVVTRALRKAGVVVPVTGKVDYRNEGISYTHTGEYTATGFLADVVAAGFQAHQFRARVTITELPSK